MSLFKHEKFKTNEILDRLTQAYTCEKDINLGMDSLNFMVQYILLFVFSVRIIFGVMRLNVVRVLSANGRIGL